MMNTGARRIGIGLLAGISSIASQAAAQCAPDPTTAETPTLCSGVDPDGLTVSATGATVTVQPGATVLGRPDDAGAIFLDSAFYVTLDNSGAIMAAGGPALATNLEPGFPSFQGITNRVGATISGTGAIAAYVERLDNAGMIDGGSGTAVKDAGAIFNTGTIRSEGASATIDVALSGPQLFANSGSIVNSGTGLAIDAGGMSLNLFNDQAGVIGTNGTIALRSDFQLQVNNRGTIDGAVVGGNGFDDFVDTHLGTINGDVLLNGADDRLAAALGTGRLVGNVSGTIDGGEGTDLLELYVERDSNVADPVLPAGFEQLQLNLDNGSTLTLAGATVPSGGYSVRGNGRVVIGADFTTDGPLLRGSIVQENRGFETLDFVNARTIVATLGETFEAAVTVGGSSHSVVNSGTIRARGGVGLAATIDPDGLLDNSGLIEASGTAVYVSGSVNNSGVIRSTGGIGLDNDLGGGEIRSRTSTNSGTIQGVDAGASISAIILVNSGTIAATGGTGVVMSLGGIDNRAGATIRGTTAGIVGAFGGQVVNAGTIDGDVVFVNGYNSSDIFVDRSGIVNGRILLGDGDDLYVADLGRGLSGAIRGVDAGDGRDSIRFIADADASAVVAPVSGFELLSYEVQNGARLALSASGTTSTPLSLTGIGRIDLTVNITAASEPLLDLSVALAAQQLDPLAMATGSFTVVSHGTLSYDASMPAGLLVAVDLQSSFFPPDARTVTFENAGTIDVSDPTGVFTPIAVRGGTVVNSSTIRVDGAIGVAEAISFTNSGTIVEDVSGRGSIGVLNVASTENSGTIRVNGTAILGSFGGFGPAWIVNSGLIESRSGTAIDLDNAYGSMIVNAAGGIITSAPSFAAIRASGLSLLNAGTINGDVNLARTSSSSTYVADGGVIRGDLLFGAGNDILVLRGDSIGVTGRVDGGDGRDTFVRSYGADATVTLGAAVPTSFETEGVEVLGNGTVTLTAHGPFTGPLVLYGDGAIVNRADIVLAADDGAIFAVRLAGMVDGGTGALDFANAATIRGGVQGIARRFANSGTIIGAVILDDEANSVENSGTIDGDVFLRGGDDSFTAALSAVLTGTVDGGTGVNALVIDTTGGVAGTGFDLVPFFNFQSLAVAGSGTVTLGGSLAFATVELAGGVVDVAPGTILSTGGATTISGSDLADRVVNRGMIAGSVAFGGGDDSYAVYPGAAAGGVDGGDGNDAIEFHAAGTEAAPTVFDRTGLANFERLAQAEGVTSIGDESFQRIDVMGGRLIGRAGSTLAATVTIASGATFGSAGTVVGDIAVAAGGTLSPGASPGTMAVQGNVSLAGGSIALFEATPAVTDKLVVSGTLSIDSGTTLEIVGDRPLTPGVALDLIVADGGISGSFTTTNKAAGVLGFLLQTRNRLQLLGQFGIPAGTPAQTGAAIAYVNDVLVAGQGSPALLAAIPGLLSGGNTNVAAFAQLPPEAYASAAQLGVEQGLSIALASRNGATATRARDAGLYGFGQGLGDWRRLNGNGTIGVSRADSHSYGAMGGIGFGSEAASASAFIGYVDSKQTIRAVGARTSADGVFVGVSGRIAFDGLDVGVLAAYVWSEADTRRPVPGGTARSGDYGLRSLVLDASIAYDFALGRDWAFRPEGGLTHVSTRRGHALESGSAAFALDIDRDRVKATFIDGAIGMRGGVASGAIFHPWLKAGVRRQLAGRSTDATASFAGVTTDFTVLGASRKATMATAGAGVAVDIMPNMSLFGSYNGEFGGGRSNNVNVGARIIF